MVSFSIAPAANVVPVIQCDANGNSINTTTAVTKTIGTDKSTNAPTGPGAASSFTWNSLTINLLNTIAANANRNNVEIMNTSGSIIVLVIDDGSNTAGTVSLIPLGPGSGQYQQGGDWQSTSELGRIRVYGTTGTFVVAREN